jgi:hypothetical protein
VGCALGLIVVWIEVVLKRLISVGTEVLRVVEVNSYFHDALTLSLWTQTLPVRQEVP